MNRMISMARIMFAGLGLYLLIGIIKSNLGSIIYIFQNFKWENFGLVSLSLVLSIALAAAIIIFLLVRGESTARKLIGRNIGGDKPLDIGITLTMAFRLICVGVGLLCLRSFVYTFSNIIISSLIAADFETFRRGSLSINLVNPALYLALSIYLICGAPHFVSWQVKKTLKLCQK